MGLRFRADPQIINAAKAPSATAWWMLTLAVLLTHLWLLKGGLSSLVLAPGAATVSAPSTSVRLQLQTPQTQAPKTQLATQAQSLAGPGQARPKPRDSTRPPAPTPLTSDPSAANLAMSSASAEDLASPAATTAEPSQALSTPPQSQSGDSAIDSVAKNTPLTATENPAQPTGPRITEAGSFPPVAVPGPMKLRYKLQGQAKGFNYSARGELLWLPSGERYEARLEISAFLLGSRVQTSRGEITPNGLQPQRFSDKVRSEVAAHFDWAQRQVIFSANTPKAELLSGAQDHLSAFIALASLLGGDLQRYLPDGEITLQAVGPREADMWRVQMNGEETLDLPAGQLTAYKLTRPPVKPYDLHVELWMAPSLGFLPARIRLTQHNGDFIDQLLQDSSRP